MKQFYHRIVKILVFNTQTNYKKEGQSFNQSQPRIKHVVRDNILDTKFVNTNVSGLVIHT